MQKLRILWVRCGDRMPWGAGVRQWRGSSGRPGNQLFACGLFGGDQDEPQRIRSSHRYLSHPAFLARPAGDFAVISFPSGAGLRLDFKGVRLESPLLLCSRGADAACVRPAWDQESPVEAEEGDNSCACRSDCPLNRCHPSFDFPDGAAPCRPGEVGGCSDKRPRDVQASPPDGFPSPSYTRKVGHPRLRKGYWTSPKDQNLNSFASDGQISFPGGRTCGTAGSRWISASSACSARRSARRSNSGSHTAESSHDRSGGPLDWPRQLCRPIFRKQLKFVHQRDGQKGEASSRACKSIRQLHATRGAVSLPENETHRCHAFEPERVQGPFPLHQVLREARWISEPEGASFGAMVDGPRGRLPAFGRCEGSPGVDIPWHGDGRPGLSGRRKVRGSLLVEFAGRPTTGSLRSSGPVNKSPAGCFLADLPASMDYDNFVVHQRDGPDQHQTSGGLVRTATQETPSQSRGRYREASAKKASPEVPKEAKRRGRPKVSSCTFACMPPGSLCSEIRSCQVPAEPVLPPDAKTSGGRDSSAQSYWNSLQTFSFARWCSRLLPDVLSSSTPFAAFLKTTLHTSRSDTHAPDKALFPLPFPKFRLFASRSSRQSSRARRRLAFDQAFHVVIAALNFLHADCSFPPLDLLVRVPSASQQQALWN